MAAPETTLPEFLQSIQRRDFHAEFARWYAQKTQEEPRAYPPDLTYRGWLETFGFFIVECSEQAA